MLSTTKNLPNVIHVRMDNPHFAGNLIVLAYKELEPNHPDRRFGFTHYCTVGCLDNKWRADYFWHKAKQRWELGAN